jgi:hypothetical protein
MAHSALREEEFVMVLAILVNARRKKGIPAARSVEDLRDVLTALRVSGHCLIPCGAIDAMKQALKPYGTEKPLDEVIKKDRAEGAHNK